MLDQYRGKRENAYAAVQNKKRHQAKRMLEELTRVNTEIRITDNVVEFVIPAINDHEGEFVMRFVRREA